MFHSLLVFTHHKDLKASDVKHSDEVVLAGLYNVTTHTNTLKSQHIRKSKISIKLFYLVP